MPAEASDNLEYGVEEARSLCVDKNAVAGFGENNYARAVAESKFEPLSDTELICRRDAWHVCRMILKGGGWPMRFMQNLATRKRL